MCLKRASSSFQERGINSRIHYHQYPSYLLLIKSAQEVLNSSIIKAHDDCLHTDLTLVLIVFMHNHC